jgi:hypothetical protein
MFSQRKFADAIMRAQLTADAHVINLRKCPGELIHAPREHDFHTNELENMLDWVERTLHVYPICIQAYALRF